MKEDLQFLNDGCHLSVVGSLSLLVAALLGPVDAEAAAVAAEDARKENTGPHLRLEDPLDLEHAPVSLDRDRG